MGEQSLAVVKPRALSEERLCTILDIRGWDERHGDIGFIPGSRWRGEIVDLGEPRSYLGALDPTCKTVLVCLSGRRSAVLQRQLHDMGRRDIQNLEGGMLRWCADRLPTSGTTIPLEKDMPKIDSLADFPRVVRSCFVAEWAMVVEEDLGMDPLEVVDEIIGKVVASADVSLETVLQAVDGLAELARRNGHPMENIANNIDRMNAAARRCFCG